MFAADTQAPVNQSIIKAAENVGKTINFQFFSQNLFGQRIFIWGKEALRVYANELATQSQNN